MQPRSVESRWAARIDRARHLATTRPEAAEALAFFAELTAFQQSLVENHPTMASAFPDYLRWLERNAPAPIAEAAARYDGTLSDAPSEFIHDALLNAFPPDSCPDCAGPPVVSLLREAGHGAKRSYVCGACLRESPGLRLGCRACGETALEKLAVFRSEETDPARIDACESCRVYVKTIDLTRDGSACPIADDLASVTLDLWAREQGYRRARPNLLRLG